ncbi:MAG TPA: hypothetical protein DCK98_10050 [Chloroflexi bacterium]|nr:hypothetical protein [Chloroflexota bacterium]HAL26339.1 hypothetical protein [Chloroflexota bacterium]
MRAGRSAGGIRSIRTATPLLAPQSAAQPSTYASNSGTTCAPWRMARLRPIPFAVAGARMVCEAGGSVLWLKSVVQAAAIGTANDAAKPSSSRRRLSVLGVFASITTFPNAWRDYRWRSPDRRFPLARTDSRYEPPPGGSELALAPGAILSPMAETARSASYQRGVVGRTLGHLLDSEKVFGYVLVAPAIIYIVALVAYPFGIALWFTVTDARVGDPLGKFTGLDNLKAVLDDDIFRRALTNTLFFTLASQALQMLLGTTLAFLLLRKFRFRRTIRAFIMLPFTIPVAIGAMAWNWMLNPTYSVINWFGEHLGFFQYGPNWLGEENYAMASIIIVNVWRNLPFTAIVLTAGISAVPQEIIEAASLDGASFLTRWRKVMVPIIAPILYIALLFSLVFTFTDMTVVWLLTKGNPVNATHVLASYAFNLGILGGALGRGATVSLFLFPVLLAGALFMLRALKARQLD